MIRVGLRVPAAALLLALGLGAASCARRVSEADQAAARSTVEMALRAGSYEDFLRAFTEDRRARMEDTAIWIRWWQEKLEKQRGQWHVIAVAARGDDLVEVTTEHRRRTTSHQFYRLVKEGPVWRIREIESER